MLHTTNPEILFLQQEEVIKAGLLDMKQILAVTEKTYEYMGKGLIKNPPKCRTRIPDDEHWTSFFNSMPCYIGGDINIAGIKWAAESKKNAHTPGIPYGIDITILSDPETVLPFCILDGTLVTAMRTSAVGGLLAKFSAPSNTETVTLVGAGVIGRTMIMSVCEALPTVKTIYLCDLDVPKAEKVAAESPYKDKVKIIPTGDSKGSALKSQLIITETTTSKPIVDTSWLTPGCAVISMASNEIDLDVVRKSDVICIDYWDQMITYKGKAVTQLYDLGELGHDDVAELGDLVLGRKKGRTSDSQTVFATSMGIGALDIMIGYQLYLNASKMGLGTKVKMWDKPLWE
ncbi:MAG: ornithine cyclodeaminase family protein [Oscillospiraceae bacterium]|jgi:ornithine cyclodeaminase/alanine dehydrogenase-like protein (mu-crystallin family)